MLTYQALNANAVIRVFDSAATSRLFAIIRDSIAKLDGSTITCDHTAAYHANFLRSLLRLHGDQQNIPHNPQQQEKPASQEILAHHPTQPEAGSWSEADPPAAYDATTHMTHTHFDPRYQFANDGPSILGGVAHNSAPVIWDDWWPLDDNYVNHDNLTGDFDADLQLLLDSALDTRGLH